MENIEKTVLDDSQSRNPEEIGWKLLDDPYSVIWTSLILDNKGVSGDYWNNKGYNNQNPNRLPKGWKLDEAIYDDGTPIPTRILSQQLSLLQEPNNWSRAVEAAKSLRGRIIPEAIDSNIYISDDVTELEENPYIESGPPEYTSIVNGDLNSESPPYQFGENLTSVNIPDISPNEVSPIYADPPSKLDYIDSGIVKNKTNKITEDISKIIESSIKSILPGNYVQENKSIAGNSTEGDKPDTTKPKEDDNTNKSILDYIGITKNENENPDKNKEGTNKIIKNI